MVTKLLFHLLALVLLPGALALHPNKRYPDAKCDSKVWKGVAGVQGSQQRAGGNQAGNDKKEKGLHDFEQL